MDPQGLSELYAYNAYANELLLQTVIQVPEGQLHAPSSPSRGDVCTLLIHMLAVEKYFLYACTGQAFAFNPGDCDDLEEMRQYWQALETERQNYLGGASQDDLAQEIHIQIREREFRLPRWQLLTQALVHSIHHRGELSIVLSQLGHPLPTLDPIVHFARESGQEWPWE